MVIRVIKLITVSRYFLGKTAGENNVVDIPLEKRREKIILLIFLRKEVGENNFQKIFEDSSHQSSGLVFTTTITMVFV
jgi:hypothetical protein